MPCILSWWTHSPLFASHSLLPTSYFFFFSPLDSSLVASFRERNLKIFTCNGSPRLSCPNSVHPPSTTRPSLSLVWVSSFPSPSTMSPELKKLPPVLPPNNCQFHSQQTTLPLDQWKNWGHQGGLAQFRCKHIYIHWFWLSFLHSEVCGVPSQLKANSCWWSNSISCICPDLALSVISFSNSLLDPLLVYKHLKTFSFEKALPPASYSATIWLFSVAPLSDLVKAQKNWLGLSLPFYSLSLATSLRLVPLLKVFFPRSIMT